MGHLLELSYPESGNTTAALEGTSEADDEEHAVKCTL